MNILKGILDGMKHDDEKQIIEELREHYDTDAEFIQAIIDDDDISDSVSEYADSEVDIYTYNVYKWIAENGAAVAEHEEEAIGMTAGKDATIEKIGQMCQYMQAEANAREALASARKVLEDDTQEALETYEKAESDLMDETK